MSTFRKKEEEVVGRVVGWGWGVADCASGMSTLRKKKVVVVGVWGGGGWGGG